MEKTTEQVQAGFTELIAHLHRGGGAGYWWRPGKTSADPGLTSWWPAGKPIGWPNDANVYFGVNPCLAIPERKDPKTGRLISDKYLRGKLEEIAAINCLFAEFDAKDFGGSMGKVLEVVNSIKPPASAVICSGGGYHVYWLLRDPFILATEEDRQRAKWLQAAWVRYVGADGGAKDLARVLRVPGTLNAKYIPARPVTIERLDLQRIYSLEDFKFLAATKPTPAAPKNGGGKKKAYVAAALQDEVQKVRGANEGERNNQLNKSALALGQLVAAGELAESEVIAELTAAGQAIGLEDREISKTIRSGLDKGKSEPRVIPERADAARVSTASHADGVRSFDLSDIGNGKRLADRGRDKLRYVKEWGWLCWDGKRWQIDQTGMIERMAKESALSIFEEAEPLMLEEKQAAEDLETAGGAQDMAGASLATARIKRAQARMNEVRKWALQSQAYTRRLSMVADASSESGMVARPEQFDRDPMLLNCKNGTLDLRTGKLEPHAQAYCITRLVPFEFDPDAKCPTWTAFLHRVFAEDKELIAFIRRAMGYSLTGLDDEQCLFFLHGVGNNGKSKFAGVLEGLLGDYAKKTRAETLLTKHNSDAVPNDVAELTGARLVIAAELPEGRRLNESLVKDLTGSDMMSARFMRRDFFQFKPQFKLWMYGNHKPTIRGTDEGIWRRIKLVPFDVVIPKDERDPRIGEKLRAEMPGILAWALIGCLAWQAKGLEAPARVEAATAKYRAEQDELGAFINDCCVVQAMASVRAGLLYESYAKWCGGVGKISSRDLGIQLGDRGFTPDKGTKGVRIWRGIGLADQG